MTETLQSEKLQKDGFSTLHVFVSMQSTAQLSTENLFSLKDHRYMHM